MEQEPHILYFNGPKFDLTHKRWPNSVILGPAHKRPLTWSLFDGERERERNTHRCTSRAAAMNARSLTPVLLFLSISSLLPSSSQNPNPKNYPRSSRRFAEALIRDLNLIPGIQEIDGQIPENDQRNPRLVEKKLNLDILGDIGSGISIQELGHHAGYYSLNHTHAAR